MKQPTTNFLICISDMPRLSGARKAPMASMKTTARTIFAPALRSPIATLLRHFRPYQLHQRVAHSFKISWPSFKPRSAFIRTFTSTSCNLQSHSRSNPGPINPHAQAIPFSLSRSEATALFNAHLSSGFFTSGRFVTLLNVSPQFLPFWSCEAQVLIRVVGGEVGFERTEPRYDWRTRRWVTERITEWMHIDREFEWDRNYSPTSTSEDMKNAIHWLVQPATFDHPRRYLSSLITKDVLSQAVKFQPHMVDDPDLLNPRKARDILPFELPPNVFASDIESRITQNERYEAEHTIRRAYNADNVRLLQVQVSILQFKLTPLYVPAYVFTTSYMGNEFATFVAAANGTTRVSGPRYFSWERVAIASSLFGLAYAFLAGLHKIFSMSGVFWTFIVVPALLGAFGSRYFPVGWAKLQGRWQDFERRRMEARAYRAQAFGSGRSEEEYMRGFGYGEYRREREEARRRSDRERSYDYGRAGRVGPQPTSPRSDPKGYYNTLGVKPSATKEEIQAAFRGLAMKDHPDRYSDPKEKEEAKKRFQKLSEAYGVLRDAGKRREYDLYGRSSS